MDAPDLNFVVVVNDNGELKTLSRADFFKYADTVPGKRDLFERLMHGFDAMLNRTLDDFSMAEKDH